MLVDHMKQGLSFEAFAGVVGVSNKTLYNWVNKYEEFSEAKEKGSSLCRNFWEKLGIRGAAGKLPGFNAAAWIFNMKNRFKWVDRHDVNHTGEMNKIYINIDKEDSEL